MHSPSVSTLSFGETTNSPEVWEDPVAAGHNDPVYLQSRAELSKDIQMLQNLENQIFLGFALMSLQQKKNSFKN